MGKHTPGPWRVNYNCFGASGMNVEIINEVKAEEVMANAHLIAAAPDLLEAVETVARFYQDYFEIMPVAFESIAFILDAANAKAKGR